MKRIIMFSGGAASYGAAVRTVEEHGTSETALLFCDVGEEDESTYDAVRTGAAALGMRLIWTTAGNVWDLFNERGMMGSPGAGLCSRILKREHAKAWVDENAPDAEIVIGMTWEETHRLDGPRVFWAPHRVRYPMVEEPWATRDEQIDTMRRHGVTVPDLYSIGGFQHANCGGACVKAGLAQWRRLLEVRPERFARWEENEARFRRENGKNVSILRDRTGGTTKPLTLERLRLEGNTLSLFDVTGGAGCGCFSDD